MSIERSRRGYLRAGLAGAALGLSGCLRLSASETPTPGSDEATTGGTSTETASSESPEGSTATATEAEATPGATENPPDASLTAWPMFRADPEGTGHRPDAVGPTGDVSELFRIETDGVMTTSPVVADGRVYISGGDEKLRAVDASTGEIAWTQIVPGAPVIGSVAAAPDGNRLFVGTRDRTVYALDRRGGGFVWEHSVDVEGFWGSPVVAGDALFVGDVRGGLHALSPRDGSVRWRYATEGKWLVSTPAVDREEGVVYVSTMTPLELPDGHEEFFFDYTGSPAQVFQFFGSNEFERFGSLDAEGTVEAVDARSGEHLWTATLPDFVVSSPAATAGRVFAGCWDGKLYGLAPGDGSVEWSHETAGPISGSPTVADGRVYVGSGGGDLYCVAADSGAREWFLPIGSPVTSAPSIAGGIVYVGTNREGVVAVDAGTGRRVWGFTTARKGQHNSASAAVSGGRVFITGDIPTEDEGKAGEIGGLFAYG